MTPPVPEDRHSAGVAVRWLLDRWHLPQPKDAVHEGQLADAAALFVVRIQPSTVPLLELPGLGPHFAIGCQTRYPDVLRSYFGVHAGDATVNFARLIDVESDDRTSANFQAPVFVNSDLYALADALHLWRLMTQQRRDAAARNPREYDQARVVDALYGHLVALWDRDPRALADDSTFWGDYLWRSWAEFTDAEDVLDEFLIKHRGR